MGNDLQEIIDLANQLHATIHRFQNDDHNTLEIQGWLADIDDLRECFLEYKEKQDEL